jgi:hypothetical protein
MEEIQRIVKPVRDLVWASGRPENADLAIAEKAQN